jgi:hypothetical protein
MAGNRQFEILLLRLVPHVLRDDFMTVGVMVVENGGQGSAVSHQENPFPVRSALGGSFSGEAVGIRNEEKPRVERFADVRFTRDWKRVECFAPDFEVGMMELVEATVRAGLREVRGRDDLLRLLEGRFGSTFDVGPVKALVAVDPVAEMKLLTRDYLDPMRPAEHERGRHMGRIAIVGEMRDAFAEAGVLELMQRDLEMKEFTGENDPFRVDFGFRVGKSLKMFQGLALNLSREPAVTLAYRYGRIREGMRARGEEALMTAIVSEEAMRESRREVASGVAMLRVSEVEVRGLGDMSEIAEGIRREIGA